MGLDTMLYKIDKLPMIKDINDWDEINHMLFDANGYDEIAYARKCWALSDWFMNKAYRVDRDKQVGFLKGDVLREFVTYVEPKIEVLRIAEGRIDELSEEEYDLVEKTLDELFDEADCYQLGADWEANRVIEWYNDIKTLEVENDDDYFILMSW